MAGETLEEKMARELLTNRDPAPVRISNIHGASPFVLLGDHAGNRVPTCLNDLGLAPVDLNRHIALDIGVEALGHSLSRDLDAPFIEQRYSRLVIDCNRDPGHPESIPSTSDGTRIPANETLDANQRLARDYAIHKPYHEAIADLIAVRDSAGLTTILVSLHSFTPSLNGEVRPWQMGILYRGGQEQFATAVLAHLSRQNLIVGDNEPYRFDETDFTIPRHAFPSQRHYVELEIRQDTLGDREAIAEASIVIGNALEAARTMVHGPG